MHKLLKSLHEGGILLEEQELNDEYFEIPADKPEKAKKNGSSFLRSQLIIIAQVLICALILGFAFVARAIGGCFYASTASWYFDSYNASLFTGGERPGSPFKEDIVITETSLISPESLSARTENAKPLKSFVVTSPYGKRELNGKTELHKGIDLASDEGSEIFAVFDGEAVTAEADASYGNYIVLKHTDGAETLYAHCSRLLIKKGDKVKAGQPIAVIGSTGDADGTHLHFELHKNGSPVDPTPLIGNDP